MNMTDHTTDLLDRIRATAPLVHNITNFVAMNSSANILLAAGASPVMAHSIDEVAEMTALAGALVLNIGTLDRPWVESMIRAAKAANIKGIPVILDPVGAGATSLRTDSAKRIMEEATVSVLRGNASEILALTTSIATTRGVDSTMGITPEVAAAAIEAACDLGCIIAMSGEEDIVTDGVRVFRVGNGTPIMTRVTGTGCGLSAVTGAFCAVAGDDRLAATAAAFGFYGLCGEQAEETIGGPGSFFVAFLDALSGVGRHEIEAGLRVRETSTG